jgi:tetratricopeptide (TPR) repeat protein
MNRIMRSTLAGLAVTLLATPAAAQIYIPPQCEVETSHFLVRQAALYVKAAAEAKNPEKQNEALQDAFRVLNDAIERGEEGNPNVWYFFGRAYQMVPDLAGMDSSFTKVETLMPDCEEDTNHHRYSMWVPVYNQAVEALQAGDFAAAKPHLTEASIIYHKEPFVPFYLGSIWAQEAETDSAIRYFKEVIAMAVDTGAYKESYDISVYNTARLYHQMEDLDSAVVYYEAYRQLHPEDATALTGLAAVYEARGDTERATAAFDEILSMADSMEAMDLFSTGVSLFQQENFELAARALQRGLEKNPYHRDGMYNLTQSFFAIANPDPPEEGEEAPEPTEEELAQQAEAADKMLEAAERLAEFDHLNEDSQRLLAAAWQLQGNDDSTLAVVMRLDSIQFDITVFSFYGTDGGSDIQGSVRNRKETEITVPSITFEFVDAQGMVLGTEVFESRTLTPEESVDFHFTPAIEGIAAWRYRAESTD